MEHVTFTPKGVCAMQIDFDLEDGKLHNVQFIGGCYREDSLLRICRAFELVRS